VKPQTETALGIGVIFKLAVIWLGRILIVIWAVLAAIAGEWLFAGLLLLIGLPLWFFVADIATGLIVAPIVGLVALFSRKREPL
jgi:hypothetical protein